MVVVLTAMFVLALVTCVSGGSKGDSVIDGGVYWNAFIAENPDDPFVASYSSGDDDYLVIMHLRRLHDDVDAQLVGALDEPEELSESNVGTREMCLNEVCHSSWDKIKESTIVDGESTVYIRGAKYNVHNNIVAKSIAVSAIACTRPLR